MRRWLTLLLVAGVIGAAQAQIEGLGGFGKENKMGGGGRNNTFRPEVADTSSASQKGDKVKLKTYPLALYRFYGPQGDTVRLDTVLTPTDLHRANFTGRDIYGYMPFQNIGQPLNRLILDDSTASTSGSPVPESMRFSTKNAGNLLYYRVPTPFSRLFFLSGNKKGQMLDSRLGVNIRPYWNLALGYKGVNSLGYYLHSLTSQENWFFNTDYRDPSGWFDLRLYLVKNHLENDENNGITDEIFFESGGSTYADRGKIPVRSTDDQSIWHSREMGGSVAVATGGKHKNLKLKYAFDAFKSYYEYHGGVNAYGTPLSYSIGYDSIANKSFVHRAGAEYALKNGRFDGGIILRRMFVRYDTTFLSVPESTLIVDQGLFVNYRHTDSALQVKIRGEWFKQGLYALEAKAGYGTGRNKFLIGIAAEQKRPAPVYWSHQSRFAKFNWHITPVPEKRLRVHGAWVSPWGELSATYNNIRHLHYFGQDSLPHVHNRNTGIWNIRYRKDWHKGHWGVFPEITGQGVTNGGNALDLPKWRVRTTLYYTDWWFTHHLYLNAGIRFSWFSKYYMAGYLPLTGTFYQQRNKQYGNFYLADVFFNFKVKKFYAFMMLSHVNAYWERSHPNYYSAPYYPYADEIIRLGIIWEFTN